MLLLYINNINRAFEYEQCLLKHFYFMHIYGSENNYFFLKKI